VNSSNTAFRFAKQTAILLFLLGIAALVVVFPGPAVFPLSGVHAGELLRLEQSAVAMGSTYSIAVYGEDQTVLETAVDQAFDEARRLDDLLSNYKPDSEWSVVNRSAADHPVKISPELFDLLSACVNYSRDSEGAFDISVGPLMKVWGFYKGSGHLPKHEEIAAAEKKVGWRNIELDPVNHTVHFRQKGIEIDPGGIGKGYAVDRMVDVLRKNGIKVGLVSGSGSSIYAMGAPPGETGWHIEIKNPRDTQAKAVEEVVLRDESMSTSGSYEKFFKADGKVYSHIMDPRTGYPSPGMLSVSVIAPRTLDSEAWAKPLFINGREWAGSHMPHGMRAFFCEDKANQPCAWLQ
jgi:thiamine biosynthesis lipoprotein